MLVCHRLTNSGRLLQRGLGAATAGAERGRPRSQVAGTVAAVEAQASRVTVKTDKADDITVTTSERTLILHLPAGETDVRKGTKMALSDLGVGDRVAVFFRGAADQKTVEATSLVVRTKADLDGIAKAEADDWRKRGTTGQVMALDPAARTITLKVGQRTVTVAVSDKTDYHRYAPDSAKFSDAKPSSSPRSRWATSCACWGTGPGRRHGESRENCRGHVPSDRRDDCLHRPRGGRNASHQPGH